MKMPAGVCTMFAFLLQLISLMTVSGVVHFPHGHTTRSESDVFRSDATLKFMRRNLARDPGNALKDAGKGPAYHDEEAREAAEKQAEENPSSGQNDPLEAGEKAVRDAGKGPAYHDKDARKAAGKAARGQPAVNNDGSLPHVNKVQRDVGKGANYHDKDAQRAARKVLKKHGNKGYAGPPNPIESIGKAAEEADEDAGSAVKAGNPIEAIGKAAEDADKDAAKSIAKGESPLDALGKAAEEADEDAADVIAGKEPEKKKKKALKTKVTAEEMDTSVDGCRNSPKGWQDSQGQDCDDYASGEWCTRYGRYGDGWLDEWGSFEDRATDGKAATQACCVCGGGISKNPVAPAPADASAAPSPAEAAAPSPGPAPGPGVDYTMAYRPLQEQGFHGDLVMHEDQETMTGDWGREFGPQSSGHKDLRKICADHPGNEWCLKHFPPKSSAMTSKIAGAAVALCLIVANGL